MPSKRLAANRNDPRTYAEEPHVTICWAGVEKTQGRNGRDNLLPFVQGGCVFVRHTVATATDSVDLGDFPRDLAILGVTNLTAVTAGTTATLALENLTNPAAHTLMNAQSLATVGAKTSTPVLNTATRRMTMTLASATANDVITLAIEVCPLDKAYS